MKGKMDYEEFKSVIKGKLEKRFLGWTVIQSRDMGVNDIERDKLTLIMGNGGIPPTMTVRNLYESYLADSMEAAVGIFEAAMMHSLCVPGVACLERNMSSYEWAKDKLMFALYNYDSNKKYFEDTVHYRWLDLMLVLQLDMKEQRLTGFVKKTRQQQWSVSDETLYQSAMQNMQSAEWRFNELGKEICSLSEGKVDAGIEDGGLYVLTNGCRNFGAAAIAVPDILKRIAEKLGTEVLIIFPCSIHEVLLMAVKEKPGWEEVDRLRNMVREINKTTVEVEYRLSNNVYIYQTDVERVLIL